MDGNGLFIAPNIRTKRTEALSFRKAFKNAVHGLLRNANSTASVCRSSRNVIVQRFHLQYHKVTNGKPSWDTFYLWYVSRPGIEYSDTQKIGAISKVEGLHSERPFGYCNNLRCVIWQTTKGRGQREGQTTVCRGGGGAGADLLAASPGAGVPAAKQSRHTLVEEVGYLDPKMVFKKNQRLQGHVVGTGCITI